ncbi:MAG: 4-hydroxythreonine-4-phosphate dehydrogenase PdxA [SAR202 cluster bacterium]|nr:4-hydroxythreonine-4-phosphate dehydrogenase PdxA [SAR202 cluster bacterium]
MAHQATLAITLGDPVGIGPEVTAKALAKPELRSIARPLVIGSTPVLQRAIDLVGASLTARAVASATEPVGDDEVAVLDDDLAERLLHLPLGRIAEDAGRVSVEWVLRAARLAIDGQVDAIVTAPINKAAAHLAGYTDVGHMELFQSLTKSPNVATMLLTPGLRVVHLTTHRSLRVACDYVTTQNVLAKLRLTHGFFTRYGFPMPRIGVAALNPHGGEEGLLGREEIDQIAPAVEAARDLGMDVTGPIPADSVFNQAIHGKYDVVLAMYHDQGHIAIKVHGWEESITLNLGLPFLRTSVDHGTAFDIAGKGIADATGMEVAIRVAASLAGMGKLP